MKFPKSEYRDSVTNILIRLNYDKACEINNQDTYFSYLAEFPNSIYNRDVEKRIMLCEYNSAIHTNVSNVWYSFVKKYPNEALSDSLRKHISAEEINYCEELFLRPINDEEYQKYCSLFPDGVYKDSIRGRYEESSFVLATEMNTEQAYIEYLNKFPYSRYSQIAKKRKDEQQTINKYKNNSLPNGSLPYRNKYGSNMTDDELACIKVTASNTSDVIVIIKYKSSKKVVGHIYVRKGMSATVYLEADNTYKIFFYSGNGWNPYKTMSRSGIMGGFVANESFFKDENDIYLDYGEQISYKLSQQINGNFLPTASNIIEFF